MKEKLHSSSATSEIAQDEPNYRNVIASSSVSDAELNEPAAAPDSPVQYMEEDLPSVAIESVLEDVPAVEVEWKSTRLDSKKDKKKKKKNKDSMFSLDPPAPSAFPWSAEEAVKEIPDY